MQLLLRSSKDFIEREREREAAELGGEGREDIPPLSEFQDKTGNTALHLAARYRQPSVVELLLREVEDGDVVSALQAKNKAGQTVLHAAAIGGCLACVRAVLAACGGSSEQLCSIGDKRGLTPQQHAARRGFTAVAEALLSWQEGGAVNGEREHQTSSQQAQTLILAPPECWAHHSAPWPRSRSLPEPPPENVGRLAVLAHPLLGSLRGQEAGNVVWDEGPRRVMLSDLLRVHDWNYVRRIQRLCEDLPLVGATSAAPSQQVGATTQQVSASDLGYLDGDTAISHGTWRAALAAAGAAIAAVDAVMEPGSATRNVFCAVRPPGHHAGPSGAVASVRDPNATNGFCIFNNVAIAAAYARCIYRDRGAKKVALLDFDVHHGNGTEACVVRAAPSLLRVPFQTPFSDGIQASRLI